MFRGYLSEQFLRKINNKNKTKTTLEPQKKTMRSLFQVSLLATISLAGRDGRKPAQASEYMEFTASRKDVVFMDGPLEEHIEFDDEDDDEFDAPPLNSSALRR